MAASRRSSQRKRSYAAQSLRRSSDPCLYAVRSLAVPRILVSPGSDPPGSSPSASLMTFFASSFTNRHIWHGAAPRSGCGIAMRRGLAWPLASGTLRSPSCRLIMASGSPPPPLRSRWFSWNLSSARTALFTTASSSKGISLWTSRSPLCAQLFGVRFDGQDGDAGGLAVDRWLADSAQIDTC